MSDSENTPERPPRGVTRRPEMDADETFLRQVYAGTRDIEMALVFWDDAQKTAFLRQQFDAQRTHYRREYPQAEYDIVLLGDQPVGRLYLDRSGQFWTLLEIALLPAHRNAGLGTALMRGLLAEARQEGRTIHLHVETFNPARRLYDRLGFTALEENGVHIHMIRSPL